MLHIHFGCGRLGLGLIVPFFQTATSETILLNRAVAGANATGSTGLAPDRRNALLAGGQDKAYVIAPPGTPAQDGQVIRFDGFFTYDDDNVRAIIDDVVRTSRAKLDGVLVTASVLKAENYRSVLQSLDVLAGYREDEAVGPVYLVACENTLSAHDVFAAPELCDFVSDRSRHHVTCVHALVDRMCVEMEEVERDGAPTILVRAEAYGSLKLELSEATEPLLHKLEGSHVEFSRHVATEKEVKSWLLNGSHWLIALAAFHESEGNRDLNLNEYLHEKPERQTYAADVMREMRDGVAAILRQDPRHAAFVRDIDPDGYVEGAAQAILQRFLVNQDPITRILARFQAPSPEALTSIESFSKRLSDRVTHPMNAYAAEKGTPASAATHGVQSLFGLLASGTFIDRPPAQGAD